MLKEFAIACALWLFSRVETLTTGLTRSGVDVLKAVALVIVAVVRLVFLLLARILAAVLNIIRPAIYLATDRPLLENGWANALMSLGYLVVIAVIGRHCIRDIKEEEDPSSYENKQCALLILLFVIVVLFGPSPEAIM